MAILIAIAIPVFSAQLENARHAVDDSADRSARSMAEAHYLLCHAQDTRITGTTKLSLTFKIDDEENMVIYACDHGTDSDDFATSGSTCEEKKTGTLEDKEKEVTSKCTDTGTGGSAPDGGHGKDAKLTVTVEAGGKVASNWG